MPDLNSATLDGRPIYDRPGLMGINQFWMHTGAARYGIGHFLMLRSDYDAVAGKISPGAPSQAFPLVMKSEQGPGLTLQVVLAGAEALSTSTGTEEKIGDQPTDMVRVKVLDQRVLNNGPFLRLAEYNLMSQPFSWDTDNDVAVCYHGSIINAPDYPSPWTWSQIAEDIDQGAIFGSPAVLCPRMPTDDAPTWIPYNIKLSTYTSTAEAIDDLMSRVYYVVGYNFTDNTYTCDIPGQMNQANSDLFKQAKSSTIAGGMAERNLSRSPKILAVTFQLYNSDNLADQISQPGISQTIGYNRTVGSGTVGITQALPVGEAIAIRLDGATLNDTQLGDIADDMAPRWHRFFTCNAEQWEFAGIWPFQPDGAIRGIKWVSDSNGARTVIRLNNDLDFNPLSDLSRRLETAQNQFLTSIGAGQVTMNGGSRNMQFWTVPPIATVKTDGVPVQVYPNSSGYYLATVIGGTPLNVDTGTVLDLPQDGESANPAFQTACIFENVAEMGLPVGWSGVAGSQLNLSCSEARFTGGYSVAGSISANVLQVWRGRIEVPGFVPVSIKQVGGSDGSTTSGASWTYDVYQFDQTWNGTGVPSTVKLASAVLPFTMSNNWMYGTMIPATVGMALLTPPTAFLMYAFTRKVTSTGAGASGDALLQL